LGANYFTFRGVWAISEKHILQTDFKGEKVSYNEKTNLSWLIILERILAPLYVREKFYH